MCLKVQVLFSLFEAGAPRLRNGTESHSPCWPKSYPWSSPGLLSL